MLMLAVAVAGCSKPSRDDKIQARDDTSFELWLGKRSGVFTAAEIKEINTARQQIRYKVMQSRPGLMSAEFAIAVYAEIDGRTVHELLRTSYALQIERMKTELLNYKPQLERFEAHQKNPNLDASQKTVVAESLEKIHRLMREHEEELARLNKRAAELETPAGQK